MPQIRALPALVAIIVAAACASGVRPLATHTDDHMGLGVDSLRCAAVDGDGHCAMYGVPLYELIARPEVFHGKRVRVIGFAHFEFEGNGLYAHREDWERHIPANGIWLDPPSAGVDSLTDRYLLVEGRFDAKSRGHFGMWSGSLDSVTRYETWDRPHTPLVFQILPGPMGRDDEDSLVIVVDRPTVVAYFALTKAELDSGAEEALSDFQFYLPGTRDSLAKLGVAFRAQTGDTIVYRDRGVIRRWLPAPDSAKVGYVFLTPGAPPRAKYGVDTDTGLREWVVALLKAARRGGEPVA